MPRRKLNAAGGADAAPEFGRAPYDGPLGVPVHVKVKQLSLSTAKSSDNTVLNFCCEVHEPAGSELARHNSQSAWGSYTAIESFYGRINGMFAAMGLPEKDKNVFWGAGPVVAKPDGRGREAIEQIGSTKTPDDGFDAVCTFREKPAEGEYAAKIVVGDFLVPGAGDEDEFVEEEEDDNTEVVDEAEEEEEEASEEDAGEEAEAEEDPAFEARAAALEAMSRPELVALHGKNGYGLGGTKGVSEDDLINHILDYEVENGKIPPLEDEAAEEEPEEEEAAPPAAEPEPSRRATARRAGSSKPPF